MMSQGTVLRPDHETHRSDGPVLLQELEPWGRSFCRNLVDLVWHPELPPLDLSAEPVPVPPEKFIRTGISPVRFAESYGGHIAFVVLVYLVCTLPFFNRQPKLNSPFKDTKIEYYPPLSEYLPPINTGMPHHAQPRKGEPKLAKQEVISVPPEADNKRQTIVTPPKLKLQNEMALPNIVAWTAIPAQPIEASARPVSKLTVPQLEVQMVEPTADVSKLKAKLQAPSIANPTLVQPAADVSQLKTNPKLPPLPQVALAEPQLSPEQLKLKHGQINIGAFEPTLDAPKLPVPPQQAAGSPDAGGKLGRETVQAAPAQPSTANLPVGSGGKGQLIALGLNPADVSGPINLPNGSRSGEFHTSPGGKPDAPGTPNIVDTGNKADVGGPGGKASGPVPGIVVGQPPPGAPTSPVAGKPGNVTANPDAESRKRIIAAAMNPNIPSSHGVPAQPASKPPEPTDDNIEQKVFGRRQYYSVVQNMPNLTSATGSWIIRFAELHQSADKTAVTAPVATIKVDPAYSPDALRDRIEGNVTLYAVINTDGTVSQIRVLDSLDERLDENAVRALSRWHFLPGTKNGAPVELEAVVLIPFRMRHVQ